jgi:hypothetical protein
LQKILTKFLVSEVFIKNVIDSDDNLSVTRIFIKQIFRAIELAPPFPLPLTGLCRGWGSSGSFQPLAVALVMAMKQ